MNVSYKNKIYFFNNNDLEMNVLFLETKEKYNLDDKLTQSLVKLYLSKKRYNCSYSTETEEVIQKYF